MLEYIGRRLLLLIPTVIMISIISFAVIQLGAVAVISHSRSSITAPHVRP
jgi:ABC-type microcin C transport system permease subunit YejB